MEKLTEETVKELCSYLNDPNAQTMALQGISQLIVDPENRACFKNTPIVQSIVKLVKTDAVRFKEGLTILINLSHDPHFVQIMLKEGVVKLITAIIIELMIECGARLADELKKGEGNLTYEASSRFPASFGVS